MVDSESDEETEDFDDEETEDSDDEEEYNETEDTGKFIVQIVQNYKLSLSCCVLVSYLYISKVRP